MPVMVKHQTETGCDTESPIRPGDLVVVVIITLVASALCLYDLDGKCLWGDEMNMVWFATGERDLQLSSGNALGYLPVLRLISEASPTDFAFRLPAAICSILTVPMLFWAATLLFDRRVGVVAALFLAVNPFQLAHAQQVHSYAAFSLLALASFVLMWFGYQRNRWPYWIAFAVVSGINMHLHLFTVFVLMTEAVILVTWLAFDRRLSDSPTRRTMVVSAVVASIILTISAPLIRDWIWPLGTQLVTKLSGDVPEHRPLRSTPAFEITPALYNRAFREMVVWKAPFREIPKLMLLVTVTGLLVGWQRSRRSTATVLLWLLVPLVPITLFSRASAIDFGTRRLLFLLPYLAVLIAVGVTSIGDFLGRAISRLRRNVRPGWLPTAVAALFVLAPIAWATSYYYSYLENVDTRAAARLLEMEAKPGDLVFAWRPDHYRYYINQEIHVEDVTSIRKVLREAEYAPRIWYFRPHNVASWKRFDPVEQMLSDAGAARIHLGGDLILSFATREPSGAAGDLAERLSLLEAMLTLKPDRHYVHRQLANGYRAAGQERQAAEHLARAEELTYTDPFSRGSR